MWTTHWIVVRTCNKPQWACRVRPHVRLFPEKAEPDELSRELRAVGGADVGRDAMPDEQFRERLEHINRPQPPGDHDRQAFPRMLLDDGEDLQRPGGMRAVRHEVIRPDVVPILRPVADARAIREPQPAPFRLFLRHFEAFPRRWCAESARWASSGRHVDHRDRRRVMISL